MGVRIYRSNRSHQKADPQQPPPTRLEHRFRPWLWHYLDRLSENPPNRSRGIHGSWISSILEVCGMQYKQTLVEIWCEACTCVNTLTQSKASKCQTDRTNKSLETKVCSQDDYDIVVTLGMYAPFGHFKSCAGWSRIHTMHHQWVPQLHPEDSWAGICWNLDRDPFVTVKDCQTHFVTSVTGLTPW